MDLAAIRGGVRQALNDLDIHVYDYIRLSPKPPCALVYPDSIPSQETMGGLIRPIMVVHLLVGMSNNEAATRILDDWISTGTPTSVVDRLADALVVYNAASPSVRNYRPVTTPEGTDLLGAELVFDIF